MDNKPGPLLHIFDIRSAGVVIDDTIRFIRLNFRPIALCYIRFLLPFFILMASIDALYSYLLPASDLMLINIFKSASHEIYGVTIINIILWIIVTVLCITLASTALVRFAEYPEEIPDIRSLSRDVWKNMWKVLLNYLSVMLLVILVSVIFLMLLTPLFTGLNIVITPILIFLSIVLLGPPLQFALIGSFPASMYERSGYFNSFFQNLRWGFSFFGKTWIISFSLLIIIMLLSGLPMTAGIIFAIIDEVSEGETLLNRIPYILPFLIFIFQILLSLVFNISILLLIIVYGIYFFSLKESVEGVMFRKRLYSLKPENSD